MPVKMCSRQVISRRLYVRASKPASVAMTAARIAYTDAVLGRHESQHARPADRSVE